jgi:hypothetical protein
MSEMVDKVSFEMMRYQLEAHVNGTFFIQDGYTDAVVREGLTARDEPHDIVDDMNARAAIMAMREPSGPMKEAGAMTYGIHTPTIGSLPLTLIDGQPTKAYQAMIDEALR